MDVAEAVGSLLRELGARAAGCWRVDGDRLAQLAFAGADDLPVEVARAFAAATLLVSLDRVELGIVKAVVDGAPAVSIADELPTDVGSGLWLRRFGAARSVAVPIQKEGGEVVGVVSVALESLEPGGDEVVELVRSLGRKLSHRNSPPDQAGSQSDSMT